MGTVYEYFTAPSLTEAQESLELGPRGRFPYTDIANIDPLVQLGAFETLLTGRTFEDQLRDPHFREEIAGDFEGGSSVVRIDRSFVHAVAEAETDRLLVLADEWAGDEDFFGSVDPELLRDFLRQFQRLCAASDEEGDLYCWIVP